MSKEKLKTSKEAVKTDVELQEKLKAAANTDAVVAITKESVLSSSADDIKTGQEISDEALDGVAGGSIGGGDGARISR